MLETIDWDRHGGRLPAVVQDADTLQVLMVAPMSAAALARTRETGLVTFASRLSDRLWVKGEESGHVLHLVSIQADTDQEALLVRARPAGPASHLGATSTFGYDHAPGLGFLAYLETVIEARKAADPSESYTARMLAKGPLKVAQKVGEEGVETALAGVAEVDRLPEEAADLLFHTMMLLSLRDRSLADVVEVLRARHRPTDLPGA